MTGEAALLSTFDQGFNDELVAWRRDIHQHPELGFNEHRTARFVSSKLKEYGIETFSGIGGTGVVAKLTFGSSTRAIGFRADMDALPMQELNSFPYKSCTEGVFHGCGHDGHTTMLLGAAKYFAQFKNFEKAPFDGTIYFIFQPAEEGLGGAKAMIRDGLFERFPMEAVFGMHNMPGIELGSFAITSGPMMAACTTFNIALTGKGGHGGMPHFCTDPIIVAAEIIQALQSVVSRNINPAAAAVLSVTKIHAGEAYNIIPDKVELGGTLRYLDPKVGNLLRKRTLEIAEGVASAYSISAAVNFNDVFTILENHREQTEQAISTAIHLVGKTKLNSNQPPLLASEDFSFFLEQRPGAYIFLGNGSSPHSHMLHHPQYNFNDAALVYGVCYWITLAQQVLKN